MANPHFGNLGDVWKHVALAEALASERPLNYWETHAGSASYLLSHSPARDYGAYYLLEGGRRSSILSVTLLSGAEAFLPGRRASAQLPRLSHASRLSGVLYESANNAVNTCPLSSSRKSV
jgi:hypothetical protein